MRPAGSTALGSLFGINSKSIHLQRQSSKAKTILENEGKAGRFRRKKRGNSTHTHLAEGENYEGKISYPGKQHCSARNVHTKTLQENAVCTNTNASASPF